jgi:RNA recognition motif-containing protein
MSSSDVYVKNGFYELCDTKLIGNAKNRSSSCPPLLASPRTDLRRSNSTASTQISEDVSFPMLEPETTTVMVRHIPTRFTSSSFLEVLSECGFSATFDFFYLPMDFRTGKNMGYAFLNFTIPYFAQLFAHMFHNTRLGFTSSSKVLYISASRRQGLRENIELFRNSDLLSSESFPYFKPFVLVPFSVTNEFGVTNCCPVLSPLTADIFAYMTTKTI